MAAPRRIRPSLQTTIAPETDALLRAHSTATGKPMGQIIDDLAASLPQVEPNPNPMRA